MKNIVIVLITTVLSLGSVFSQAKKPTIMVVPSDSWCQANGFMFESIDNQGVKVVSPDYRKALRDNIELGSVITTIGGLMSERGFDLIDLESSLKKAEVEEARKSMSNTAESINDILNRTAKADFIIQILWKTTSRGPKKSVYFELKGLDAYTSKQKSAANGDGNGLVGATLTQMLKTSVLGHMDNFNAQLFSSFEDMQVNGREGMLVIELSDMIDYSLDTEYEFKGRTAELKRIINSFWMPRNTLNGRFSQDEASATIQKFSQVRIPLYGDDGWGGQIAYDFESFSLQLVDFLKKEFGIVTKVETRGLGQVNLILGGK